MVVERRDDKSSEGYTGELRDWAWPRVLRVVQALLKE